MYITEQPISREQLRMIAKAFKSYLGFNGLFIDVPRMLEVTMDKFPHLDVEIVTDDALDRKIFADFIPKNSTLTNRPLIRIKESVYNNACNPNSNSYGRDRMSITHEIAHFILIDQFNVEVIEYHGRGTPNLATTAEWQAMALAGEIIMPFEETESIKDILELSNKCGVSTEAANYRINKYMKE